MAETLGKVTGRPITQADCDAFARAVGERCARVFCPDDDAD